MSINSINTNMGALVALESLNATDAALNTAQNEISSGLKIAGAQSNGAIWQVAQIERGDVSSLGVVQNSLNRGISVADVAVNAGQTISDLLNQMQSVALSATDDTSTSVEIQAYANQFTALANQIAKVVSTADFDGANMLQSGGTSINALASVGGTVKIVVSAQSMAFKGANIAFSVGTTFTTHTTAATVLTDVNTAITKVNAAVAKLGVGVTALQTELSFVQLQSDQLTTGIGNLVDADVAAESATLTALQTKQQLGTQALSIANTAPSHLLTLFQG